MPVTKTATRSASTAEKIDHVFPDGTKFSGTFEQLEKVASALGMKISGISVCPKGYYPSESRGVVKISEMNDYHIRRALLKRSKDYFAGIFDREDDNKKFLQKYTNLLEDQIVNDLANELAKRVK